MTGERHTSFIVPFHYQKDNSILYGGSIIFNIILYKIVKECNQKLTDLQIRASLPYITTSLTYTKALWSCKLQCDQIPNILMNLRFILSWLVWVFMIKPLSINIFIKLCDHCSVSFDIDAVFKIQRTFWQGG